MYGKKSSVWGSTLYSYSMCRHDELRGSLGCGHVFVALYQPSSLSAATDQVYLEASLTHSDSRVIYKALRYASFFSLAYLDPFTLTLLLPCLVVYSVIPLSILARIH